MEGKALDIVDSLLAESYPIHEVLRCIYNPFIFGP
jgi:hypothetical protein